MKKKQNREDKDDEKRRRKSIGRVPRRNGKSETNKLLLLIAICINIIQVSFCSDKYIIFCRCCFALFLFRCLFLQRPSATAAVTVAVGDGGAHLKYDCLFGQKGVPQTSARDLQFVSDYTSTFRLSTKKRFFSPLLLALLILCV